MGAATDDAADKHDWDSHWSDYVEAVDLNPTQVYRRRLLNKAIRRRFPSSGDGLRLIDLGSGTGDLARVILADFPGAKVVGLENSKSGVELATKAEPRARFLQKDLMQPQNPAGEDRGWANVATCSEVLEHVEDASKLLSNARAYLAPNTLVVVTVPGGKMSYFDRYVGHLRHYTETSLRETLEAAGFRVVEVWRAGFPFFNLYKISAIIRGKSLVNDVAGPARGISLPARLAMFVFGILFRLNLTSTPWGWQLVAVAVNEADT